MYISHGKGHKTDFFAITGDWDIQSITLKETFPQLTDEDLVFESGREAELLAKVESRLNKPREEIINIIYKTHTD